MQLGSLMPVTMRRNLFIVLSVIVCLFAGCGRSQLSLNALGQGGGGLCGDGETRCAGMCIDLGSDPKNCGDCGVACSMAEVCNVGQCSTSCSPGLTACDGACVDKESDPKHCGGCAIACSSDHVCGLPRRMRERSLPAWAHPVRRELR